MNYPVQGPHNMMNRLIRWNVDDNRQTWGSGLDSQARLDARTGLFNHGASAASNAGEAFWDTVGMIPLVGGAINIARGLIKSAWGLCTGKGYLAKEGAWNIAKGAAYLVPGWGTLLAGVNLTKNSFDAVTHTAMWAVDGARFGGTAGKNQFALQMAYGNMGYGMQMMNPMMAYAGSRGGFM